MNLRLRLPRQQGRAQLSGLDSFPVPPPTVSDAPVSMRLTVPPKPRLRIRKLPDCWAWRIALNERLYDFGTASSQPEALAVGLAAMELWAANAGRP